MSEATTATSQSESAIILSPNPVRGVIPRTLDEAARFADAVYKGAVSVPKGITNAQGVFTIMQTGMEIGLTPMQSLQGMHIINGKVGMSGDLMLALALDNPNCEYAYGDCDKTDPNNWKGWFVSKRRGPYPEKRTEFTQADAIRAGLWNKKSHKGEPTPWQLYPDRMLYYRAMGFNLRDNFPDAFKLLKSTEELRDYPDIEPAEPQRSAPQQSTTQTPKQQAVSVDATFEDHPKDQGQPFDDIPSRHQGTDNVSITRLDAPILELYGLKKEQEHNGVYTNIILSGVSEPIDIAVPAELFEKFVNGPDEKDILKAYRRKNALAFTGGGYNAFIKAFISYDALNPKPADQAKEADLEEQYASLEYNIEQAEIALKEAKHAAFIDARNIDLQRNRTLGTTNLKEATIEKLEFYLSGLNNAVSKLAG